MLRTLIAILALLPGLAAARDVLVLAAPTEAIALTSSDVADAVAQTNPDGGALVLLKLAPRAARAFGSLTGQSVGQHLRMLVCGKQVVDAVVRTPILSGRLVFPAGSPDEAETMGRILRGEQGCPGG